MIASKNKTREFAGRTGGESAKAKNGKHKKHTSRRDREKNEHMYIFDRCIQDREWKNMNKTRNFGTKTVMSSYTATHARQRNKKKINQCKARRRRHKNEISLSQTTRVVKSMSNLQTFKTETERNAQISQLEIDFAQFFRVDLTGYLTK